MRDESCIQLAELCSQVRLITSHERDLVEYLFLGCRLSEAGDSCGSGRQ
jgi:hypothetical protein